MRRQAWKTKETLPSASYIRFWRRGWRILLCNHGQIKEAITTRTCCTVPRERVNSSALISRRANQTCRIHSIILPFYQIFERFASAVVYHRVRRVLTNLSIKNVAQKEHPAKMVLLLLFLIISTVRARDYVGFWKESITKASRGGQQDTRARSYDPDQKG